MPLCGEEQCLPDGFNKVYLLNTDTDTFTLSGTLQVKAIQQIAEKSGPSSPTWMKVAQVITDMCYMKTTDGT